MQWGTSAVETWCFHLFTSPTGKVGLGDCTGVEKSLYPILTNYKCELHKMIEILQEWIVHIVTLVCKFVTKATSVLSRTRANWINKKVPPQSAVPCLRACGENHTTLTGFSFLQPTPATFSAQFCSSVVPVSWMVQMNETHCFEQIVSYLWKSCLFHPMPEFLFVVIMLKTLISLQFGDGKQQHTGAQAGTRLWSLAGYRLLLYSGTGSPHASSSCKIL